ncbi:MAG: selenate reductase [Bacillota bacterium]|nr:selenate reductase [Bacillota bacterium]
MGDRMRGISIEKLVKWVCEEYENEKSVFGIPEKQFFYPANRKNDYSYCGEAISSPLGPAAGPHTQLAQNLAAGFLTGGRVFELKTVQVLDRLEFPKPCINAEDECYNTEWSTELSIEEAYEEYVKGWFLLHILSQELFQISNRTFMFNLSVGYDLAGIKSEKVDRFIEGLKDASSVPIFSTCKNALIKMIKQFRFVDERYIEKISPLICSTIALSTMHGCPPLEIEAICRYLILEKGLHTSVKLNPTLLGYQYVRDTLDKMGYSYIVLNEDTFSHDLLYEDAVPMLQKLINFAGKHGRKFGVKLSNTLPVQITGEELPGEQMYMSGKPLYALTINLASKLAEEFKGNLNISFSGGADRHNISEILSTGIRPVTMVTTLLKPNGYARFKSLAEIVDEQKPEELPSIDLDRLKQAAEDSISNRAYHKKRNHPDKVYIKLPIFDCRDSCGLCVAVCPNRANYSVRVNDPTLKYDEQILHIDGMCNECGNCATFCPEKGKPYLEKLTLFWNEEDFNSSNNCGFLPVGESIWEKVKFRINDKIYEIKLSKAEDIAAMSGGTALLEMIRVVLSEYLYLL